MGGARAHILWTPCPAPLFSPFCLWQGALAPAEALQQGLHSLWKFRKNGIRFSRPRKSVKTEWGLWILWSSERYGKNISLSVRNCTSQDQTVVIKKYLKILPCKITECTSNQFCKVHQPSPTVRVAPLYQMCGRVAYLCVAFLPHIAKVREEGCEFWMDFSVRTLSKVSCFVLFFSSC